MMKRVRLSLLMLTLAALACNFGAPAVTQSVLEQPTETATSLPVQNEAATAVPVSGVDSDVPIPLDLNSSATYKGLSLILQDNGAPTVTSVEDVIGVVCIGMSNGNQECGDFIRKWEQGAFTGKINPQVRFVNCAVGGRAIEHWNNPQLDPKLWDACIQQKIPAAGLRPDQIRVVWHKAASIFTADENRNVLPPYPNPDSDYFNFYDSLTTFAGRVYEKFSSVQAVYATSRSYGGYAGKPERGEPLSYEEGLALNQWLKDNPMVNGVWYGWGPYIWAPDCGTGVTNASGVCYERGDYQDDGIHPAQGARDKISMMLHERFSQFEWYQP